MTCESCCKAEWEGIEKVDLNLRWNCNGASLVLTSIVDDGSHRQYLGVIAEIRSELVTLLNSDCVKERSGDVGQLDSTSHGRGGSQPTSYAK